MDNMQHPWVVWGLDLSLFTGKLEAILRARGIPYELRDQTAGERMRTSRAVGIEHMPVIERADGSFLSDTTLIHRWLEENHSGPTLSPNDAKARFIARLIEDWGDEHWWRPAMAWRWLYPESRSLLSGRIVDRMIGNVPIPRWIKKRFIQLRQYIFYIYRDGVRNKSHRQAVEADYRNLLSVLEPILQKRPFIMGERPTEADFGLFGPFFRHFFSDPFPGAEMRQRAPAVLEWVARLWAITPEKVEAGSVVSSVPDDLGPLLTLLGRDYLPYLSENAKAVAAKQRSTRYTMQGVEWREPAKPFRLWCLAELQREFAELSASDQDSIAELLGAEAIGHLRAPLPTEAVGPPALPISSQPKGRPKDSWMR